MPDLGRTRDRHHPDSRHLVDAWARKFTGATDGGGEILTMDLLMRMTQAICRELRYERRVAEGTQTPEQTLSLGSGSCRDYALLLMEAARTLGLAARFVSGYVYDPNLLGTGTAAKPLAGTLVGTGETHAWAQVYLPGAGWVELDPTNGLIGGVNLIRVAVARDPAQAVPLSGDLSGRTRRLRWPRRLGSGYRPIVERIVERIVAQSPGNTSVRGELNGAVAFDFADLGLEKLIVLTGRDLRFSPQLTPK